MEIPKEVLVELIKSTDKKFQEYKREQYLSIDDLINITNELYDNQKKVRWLENIYAILVTFLVFQFTMSPSNILPLNIFCINVTFPVSHCPMFWLKDFAP